MNTIKSLRILALGILTAFAMLMPDRATAQEKMDSKDFIREAATAGMNEVAMGNLGQKRLQDPELKEFALGLLNDHTAANALLWALAKKKNVKLPDPTSTPFNSMQTRADTTQADTSASTMDSLTTDFDAEFVKMMVDDQMEAISLFEKGASSNDKDVRNYAIKNLPVLRRHLEQARKFLKEN